jgi:hypothetical protein
VTLTAFQYFLKYFAALPEGKAAFFVKDCGDTVFIEP